MQECNTKVDRFLIKILKFLFIFFSPNSTQSPQLPNSQLHTAISIPRYSKYFAYCGNKRRRALKLYRSNLYLSQKLYSVIGQFEVVLRNSIDRHYRSKFGHEWLANSVQPGGFLDGPGLEDSYHSVQEGIYRLKEKYSEDSLVAELTFGFWTYLFSEPVFVAGGNTLLNAFPNRPFGTNQKKIFKELFRVNEIRNRIAHYEPLCFDTKTTSISTAYAAKRYYLILDLFNWLGADPKKMLYGIDGVQKALKIINTI